MQLAAAVGNHSAQLLLLAMSGHYVHTNDAMLGQLGKMHRKCRMSDRYNISQHTICYEGCRCKYAWTMTNVYYKPLDYQFIRKHDILLTR
jgi:hypothetical protein